MTVINDKANEIIKSISSNSELLPYLEKNLPIPVPFVGSGEIKLIILGQDPTVKNNKSRKNITTVLNLDRRGSIYNYLNNICKDLGLDLEKNVYATNLLKNFFKIQPTKVKDINIIRSFSQYWLPLLLDEIGQYPNVPVLSLGEPLLSLLVKADPIKVRYFWGYSNDWKFKTINPNNFSYITPNNNLLGRDIFPYPHQPSIQKKFYKERLKFYNNFLKRKANF